ncbi:MAG: DUF3137 domain-containing protein [Vicingaceae bacterium]|nr:DUF3137 domain-containing protein [Vicingaceae bacterium]
MNKDFDIFYEQQLQPVLNNLEEIRKKINAKIIKSFLYSFLFILCGVYFAFSVDDDHEWNAVWSFFAFVTAIAIPGSIFSLSFGSIKKMKQTYKNKVLVELLLFLYDKVDFYSHKGFSANVLDNSRILDNRLDTSDIVRGEDYVKCIIGNTTIQFAEMYVLRSDYIFSKLLFKGIFISAKFNKLLNYRTIILPKNRITRKRKLRFNLQNILNQGHIINLENNKFNELFVVYGEDEIETRYVLSSSMMEKLIAYQEKLNNDVAFSFVENRMYAGIYSSTNHFEPSISKPLNNKSQILQHFEMYKIITDLVLDLDLKLRLWDKLD